MWKGLVIAELPSDVPEVETTLSDTGNLYFVYGKKERIVVTVDFLVNLFSIL